MGRKDKLIEKFLSLPKEMSFREVQIVLEEYGYELNRVKGSHHIFTQKGKRPLTIPVHKKKVTEDYIKQIASVID